MMIRVNSAHLIQSEFFSASWHMANLCSLDTSPFSENIREHRCHARMYR